MVLFLTFPEKKSVKKQLSKRAYTCGGTGGHVYPIIAVAQELSDTECIFIGSENREDSHIIPRYGYHFKSITASNKSIFKIITGFCQARKILKQEKVTCLISSGGYLTLPVVLAAATYRLPIFLLEQNVIPGRVNRALSYLATLTCLTFEESRSFFKTQKLIVTGNPVRKIFLEDPQFKWIKEIWRPQFPTLLVFGGSQGAKSLNTLFFEHHAHFVNSQMCLIHITGKNEFDGIKNQYKKIPKSQINIMPEGCLIKNSKGDIKIILMPYFEKMDWLYENVTWVVSRAGATTLAELLYFNKKAILIPYPHAKDNHQISNAQAFIKQGQGKWIPESMLTFERIIQSIESPFPTEKEPFHKNARECIANLIKEDLLCTHK